MAVLFEKSKRAEAGRQIPLNRRTAAFRHVGEVVKLGVDAEDGHGDQGLKAVGGCGSSMSWIKRPGGMETSLESAVSRVPMISP